jgi:NAD(P)-dependent dehydrogenase (short-subunit alcohol dehydrogenase family)
MSSTSKVIVITGGTGGIGYQEALALAQEKHTIVVTGRSKESAEKAVASIKEASGNDDIHYALADMSLQPAVKALAKDLLERFPKIDELINNAGNLDTTEKQITSEGIDKNTAVNVIAPLLLTRLLVPALKAATPTGKVQITSGGFPYDTMNVNDLDGSKVGVGIPAYSHSKRVMEAMAIALSEELKEEGISVNVVGGALPGATSMTSDVKMKDLPCMLRPMYCIFKMIMHKDDNGKSAKQCAKPAILATKATSDELGTGKSYLGYPTEGKFKKEVALKKNQDAVMQFVESKLV